MNEKKWHIEILISLLALGIASLSLFFTWWYNSSLGEVEPLTPSAYAVSRGVETFPSDHLIFPMEWKNDSGRSVLIRDLQLILVDTESGKEQRFLLAGEYPEISKRSFENPYSRKNSFVLDPHTVSLKTLMLHTENWWDRNDQSDYNFKFTEGSKYRVLVKYFRNSEEDMREQQLIEALTIYDSVSQLDFDSKEGPKWDYWSLNMRDQ
ncbi:MAG: hypothetical protein WA982_02405 [Rubrobacteraceae bacterium]